MGWFSTDFLKLDILMHQDITARSGRGAIRWTPLAEHPKISQNQTRMALAALNYGRLVVNQRETRTDRFHRVSDAAELLLANPLPAFLWGLPQRLRYRLGASSPEMPWFVVR
jgi:hypothetical protein